MRDSDFLFLEAAQKLKRTVKDGRVFEAAQVKVIGLDEMRNAAGARWDAMKERVRTNSMNFLQGALNENDIVIPCGDGFLVIYDERAGRNLESETETLQQALNTFYMGEDACSNLKAKVTQRTMSSRDVVGLLASDAPKTPEPEAALIRFAPACNLAQEAITSYFAVPATSINGMLKFGYNPDYRTSGRHEGKGDFVALDMALLERAIAEASRVVSGPERRLIGYSVHVTTLRNRYARERFFERLRAVPEPTRKLMIGKIAEIELGTPLLNITEWVSVMRSHTALVCLEFHCSERSFDGLDTTRANAAGFYLPLPPVVTPESRAHCHALIARWRLGLRRQRMRLFIDGVNDPRLLSSAFHEAVDYATSEAQWPLVNRAAGMRVINLHEIGLLPKIA